MTPNTSVAPDLDPLTGLGGRCSLRAALEAALAAAPDRAALLMLDLDRFKAVNDSVGHDAGDTLLCRVAERLARGAGPGAMLARVSGDGFAVLLPDGRAADAVAARLLDLVGRPYAVDGHAVAIGVSIGLARAPEDGTTATALLYAADLALHQAEQEGRNRLRRFDRTMQDRAQDRRALENDLRAALAMQQVELRRALSSEQFALYYQPQVDVATGRVSGCEALLRWRHPTRGLVPPADFIPLAEEIGVIGLLGDWALRTACRAAVAWPSHGGKPPRVAVNVSSLQLREGLPLVGRIAEALAQSGLPASRLEIEITESALIEDATATLSAIRALGVGLALDDFGTGFSSLSQLGRYPFDGLKIDRSFTSALAPGATASTGAHAGVDPVWMIRAIAGLGGALGMRTVAEGVETPAQATVIGEIGCTEIQGYFVSRPVPEGRLPELFARLADCTQVAVWAKEATDA